MVPTSKVDRFYGIDNVVENSDIYLSTREYHTCIITS